MRIFFAGSTGVLGRRMIPPLIEADHHITALVRRDDGAAAVRSMGADPVRADAFDGAALISAVIASRPDLVMHQLTDLGTGTGQTNAAMRTRGTRNLVDAAQQAGVHRIVAQSIAWVYEPGGAPATENTPLDVDATGPRAVTVAGVIALETAVAEIDEWVVLRNGQLYGPGIWYSSHGARADDARAGRPLPDASVSSFVHLDDAAAAAIQALDWPTGLVNVCDDDPAAGREWVPAFCQAVGADPPKENGSEREPWARGADNRYARSELGWQPRYPSWRQGFSAGLG
jgi:nucleoside-diphosphate-sugar epimerase